MILKLIGTGIALFAGLTLLLYLFQTRMIFFPQPTTSGIGEHFADRKIIVRNGGIELTGWLFNNGVDARHPLMVYYGGNAEDVALNFNDLGRFSTSSFLFMNYRGYGGSQGRPSEKALLADAVVALDQVLATEKINASHVVLMGRSLGSGVAVHVAAQRKVAGVILVTPFDSLVNVARAHYPIFPVGLLLKHRFDSAGLAPQIAAPALFLTAENDQVVPPRFADRLQQVWGGPASAVRIQGTDHNSIHLPPEYWRAINGFLAQLAGQ